MSNIRGLSDLGGDRDDDGGDFNDYYAGGEKSGQMIRGAPTKRHESSDEEEGVGALFNQFRRQGARAGTADDLPSNRPAAFQGTGRTLTGATTQAPQAPGRAVITFYRNGYFTVNNGPGRHVEEPENMDFIAALTAGRVPRELEATAPGGELEVSVMRREEDYQAPAAPKAPAFKGTGRTLGGEPSAASSSSSAAAAAAASDAGGGEWAGVNESKPTTSLQLRLFDGSRMVARFNTTHTVADVRRFIRAARPDLAAVPFTLATAFPPSTIEDSAQTLEAAGLLNAAIIVKK